jgi:large subunit ribosomal protein L17
MRHLKRTAKLGRTFEHRNAMLSNLVCSLIKHKRITTTLAKAKAARPVAEKMVTLGKRGTLYARRLVAARLHAQPRTFFKGTPKHKGAAKRKAWREHEDVVHILFDQIAPLFKERNGGYTRIVKLGGTQGRWAGQRQGDAAQMAILEWVEAPAGAAPQPKKEEKKAGEEAQT